MDIAAFVSAFGAGLLLVYALVTSAGVEQEDTGAEVSVTDAQGDVRALLTTQSGKCTDINSVFVGLCRAVDIPAREMFGVRMNADDITGNQHCWAEFYLNGTGRVSADPADVLKAVLKGGWTKDQQETKDKAEYCWGGLDSQRVQLSAGRDITLSLRKTTRRSTTLAIRTARWTAPPSTSTTRRTSPAASPSPRSR